MIATIKEWGIDVGTVGQNNIIPLWVKIDYTNPPLYFYLKGQVDDKSWTTDRLVDENPPAVVKIPIVINGASVISVELHQFIGGKDNLIGRKIIRLKPHEITQPTQPGQQEQHKSSILPWAVGAAILYAIIKGG